MASVWVMPWLYVRVASVCVCVCVCVYVFMCERERETCYATVYEGCVVPYLKTTLMRIVTYCY
jgi:hypothetical protein